MIPSDMVKWLRSSILLCVLLALAGCAAVSDESLLAEQAVSLRNLQIETVDGHRAVLLRLSRIPLRVIHSSGSSPATITVLASGPVGEGDFSEQALPQMDAQISQVRVERSAGELRVTLDLKSEAPPPYNVLEMADWIMIRLGSSRVEG